MNYSRVCKTGCYQDFKKWKCVGDNLEYKTRRKDQLKIDFKDNFGCKIYESKGHFGSSINGKQASLAFSNPSLFSEITGVPEFFIKGIAIALEAINSPKKICPEKYDTFAQNWLDEFHSSSWSWSWLSPSVHLLFVHGAQIFRVLPVTPNLLSGQCRHFLNGSRKT